ncbi:MAG: hypothetical protein ABJN40_11065 [Sneathiella sp.]
MQGFSSDIAGFASLTIVEMLIQECVLKGVLDEAAVNRLLTAAARRHENAAGGEVEKIELNMEAARLIRTLMIGLKPLFEQAEENQEAAESSIAGAEPQDCLAENNTPPQSGQ